MTQKKGKCLKIAVKEFAKISAGGNIVDADGSETGDIGDEAKDGVENIDRTNNEDPVSPPACSEDDYPGLVVSEEAGSSDATLRTMQGNTHQQKLSVLKAQLAKLSPNNLLELTTALKNHIKSIQQQIVTKSPKMQSFESLRNLLEVSNEEKGARADK